MFFYSGNFPYLPMRYSANHLSEEELFEIYDELLREHFASTLQLDKDIPLDQQIELFNKRAREGQEIEEAVDEEWSSVFPSSLKKRTLDHKSDTGVLTKPEAKEHIPHDQRCYGAGRTPSAQKPLAIFVPTTGLFSASRSPIKETNISPLKTSDSPLFSKNKRASHNRAARIHLTDLDPKFSPLSPVSPTRMSRTVSPKRNATPPPPRYDLISGGSLLANCSLARIDHDHSYFEHPMSPRRTPNA